jgi:alanine racemase
MTFSSQIHYAPDDPPRIPGRSTRALVDLDAIACNLSTVRQQVTPSARLMAVVKANAYGHGAKIVAKAALESGATELAVATVEEGVQLRLASVGAPILVLGPIDTSEIEPAVSARLSLAVADQAVVDAIAFTAAGRSFGPASIHLKIDTGMRRFGIPAAAAADLAACIVSRPSVRLDGTFTHFACADESDESATQRQLAEFDAAVASIRDRRLHPGLLHVANSAATLRSRRYDYDMVRIGISLYGIAPSAAISLWPGMRQALTIRSRVRRVIPLQLGDRVSYGGTYEAACDELAALIPIGYADGYHRLLSNRAWMGVGDATAPVRGRICMDQTVVGWPPHISAGVDREVVVVGDGRDAAPTLAQLAELAETIPYELVTALASRVPRQYLCRGKIVAVEDLSGIRFLAPISQTNNNATSCPAASGSDSRET